eukprot:TRINITY_DN8054_c0_g1_i2.p1 TRINITY_DN8054_c0_g1~~TRINITY_DN8054_c0_g1_i2.p1  ORF type:complete len:499 (+),score=145.05 TRINITY_DN8054_c0_g1_i2:81-1577(+)
MASMKRNPSNRRLSLLGISPPVLIFEQKMGTIDDILDYLINQNPSEEGINFLLASRKKYCNTRELFNLLELASAKEKFSASGLATFLLVWLENYFSRDFCREKEGGSKVVVSSSLEKVVNLANKIGAAGSLEEANKIKLLVLRHKTKLNSPMSSPEPGRASRSSSTVQMLIDKARFTDYTTQQIAEQMTLLEHGLFQQISIQELEDKAWSRSNKQVDAPHVTALIQRFNEVSLWTASMVLIQKTPEARTRLIERLIKVAGYCNRLNNFNSVMEIVAGLNLWSVYRIVKISNVNKKHMDMIDNLYKLMDPKRNYILYRNTLKDRANKSKDGILPYLGVYLKDITFIEEGPDYFEPGQINFEKIQHLGHQYAQIKRYQSLGYPHIRPDVALQQYLAHPKFLSEKDLEELSNAIKPSDPELSPYVTRDRSASEIERRIPEIGGDKSSARGSLDSFETDSEVGSEVSFSLEDDFTMDSEEGSIGEVESDMESFVEVGSMAQL